MGDLNDENATVCKVRLLHEKISALESLSPCEKVNTMFTELVSTCISPTLPEVDINTLSQDDQNMRSSLINLCGTAEALMESHYSDKLAEKDKPLDNLDLFPYTDNYQLLSKVEYDQLSRHAESDLRRVAFAGSGSLPLSSIILARDHIQGAKFDNFDRNQKANERAEKLLKGANQELAERLKFNTKDVLHLTRKELEGYQVVFLAALVGMMKDEKRVVIEHLGLNMAPGALLVVRSAKGARAFLYPVVDVEEVERLGFEVLSEYHPNDVVINSVIVARKLD